MSEQITDLTDYLLEQGQPASFTEIDDTKFAINNDDEALWAMRRLAKAQRHIDEIQRLASIEIERITQWVVDSTSSSNNEIDYLDQVLTNYVLRVREDENDGRKKLEFPDGTITTRQTSDKVVVEDAEAFIAWVADIVARHCDLSAIQALFDPESWSAERQIAALDAGLADATCKETT